MVHILFFLAFSASEGNFPSLHTPFSLFSTLAGGIFVTKLSELAITINVHTCGQYIQRRSADFHYPANRTRPKQHSYDTYNHSSKKELILVLPHLGVQSKIISKQPKTWTNQFYGCTNLRIIFQSAYRIKSIFPTKIGPAVPSCQKLCIILVVGTARISILEKQNVDCVTEKLNIFLNDHEQFACFINKFFSPSITVIFNFNLL